MSEAVNGHDHADEDVHIRAVDDVTRELRMVEQIHDTVEGKTGDPSQEWPEIDYYEAELRSLRNALEGEWLDHE